MTAREHAITASQILVRAEEDEHRIDALTPIERTQWHAAGGPRSFNAMQEYRVALAAAHAQTAIALVASDQGVTHVGPDDVGRL